MDTVTLFSREFRRIESIDSRIRTLKGGIVGYSTNCAVCWRLGQTLELIDGEIRLLFFFLGFEEKETGGGGVEER